MWPGAEHLATLQDLITTDDLVVSEVVRNSSEVVSSTRLFWPFLVFFSLF